MRDQSRGVLLATGRTSIRIWLRAAQVDEHSVRRDAVAQYNHLAEEVEWPEVPALRLHLALSVLPGAAVYHALREQGRSQDEAAARATDALLAMARPRGHVIGALSRSALGRDLFMRTARGSLRAFPEPGWQATWVERGPGRVSFDMSQCFDLDMLRRLGAEPIAPAYCAVDDVLYGRLDPRLRFRRSVTLATGGERCDFCFERNDIAAGPVTRSAGGLPALAAGAAGYHAGGISKTTQQPIASRTWAQRVLGQVQHPQVYREVLAESLGAQIALSVWAPPGARAVVVFVPGTGIHPLFYEEFLDALAEAGLAVVGVHPEGHGHSPRVRRTLRWRTVVGNAVDACRWARDEFGLPVVLMGSSQGGLVALLAASRGAPVVGVVAHNVFDPASPSAVAVTRFAPLAPVQRQVRAVLRTAAAVAPRLPVPIVGPLGYLDPHRVFSHPGTLAQFEADPVARRSYPLRFFADMLDADTSALFDGRLRVPVVVLAGRGDPLFALADLEATTRRIAAPSVELVVVEADCHLILNEALTQSVPAAMRAIDGILLPDPATRTDVPEEQERGEVPERTEPQMGARAWQPSS